MTPRSRLTPALSFFVCCVCFAVTSAFSGFSLRAADVPSVPPNRTEPRTIIFFGDSLTAGYGLEDPATQAYPALVQAKIAAAGLPWRVVNAGLSGETSSGGARRIDWILRQPIDLFVLALGGNDGLRGIEPALSRASLARILQRMREKYPAARVVLAGMMMPPMLGADYTREFAAMYPELAKEYSATLLPFLLAGVGGDPALNQDDQIHPTARGHTVVAETVWQAIRPLLTP